MNRSQYSAIAMLGLCMTFLFYKYLLQLFPSVMTTSLMQQYHLSGAAMGSLAACFFYGYVVMQLFAGPLVDRYGIRKLSSLALITASSGVALFAYSHSLYLAAIGRCLMGVGGAFATICYLRATASWCSQKTLAFAGGCLTFGVMLGACLGAAPLVLLLSDVGMQNALIIIAIIGLCFAIISALFLRNGKLIHQQTEHFWQTTKSLLRKKENWCLAAYSGFAFAPLAVFGGLWGTPFIEASHSFDKITASSLVSLCYIGFGFGGPLFGYLSDRGSVRQQWMLIGLIISIVFLMGIIYLPIHNKSILAVMMFGFGFGTGSFMLGFTYGKEINPVLLAGCVVGLINSGDALLGAISEPLIGKLLDKGYVGPINHLHSFSTHDFRQAFMVLIFYLIIAGYFALRLPDNRRNIDAESENYN